jgi:GNAT superfamily N-acetyltransferase
MSVETAHLPDIPDLCGLLAILFSEEAEFAPQAGRQAAGLRAIIGDPRIGLILVVREEGRIVGMVNLLWTVSTFLGTKAALLEDLVVHPDHRGKGHGTNLLRAAIERASAAGCARVTLLTDASNREAQAFYERNGFVPSTMMPMRLTLPLRG